jgi:hypothetical protein
MSNIINNVIAVRSYVIRAKLGWFLVSFALVATLGLNCGISFAQESSSDFARLAIRARDDLLRNITICYKLEVDSDPILVPAQLVARSPYMKKHSEYFSNTLSILNGAIRMESVADDRTLKYYSAFGVAHNVLEATCLYGGKEEELFTHFDTNHKLIVRGGIMPIKHMPPEWFVDWALGLRLYLSQSFITATDILNSKQIDSDDPNIVAFEFDVNGMSSEICYDKRLGYAPVYCRMPLGDPTYAEILSSDFKKMGSLYFPNTIISRTCIGKAANGQMTYTMVFTAKVKKYLVDDPENVPSRFHIVYPANEQIYDGRIERPIDVGPTSRAMTDDVIQKTLADESAAIKNSESAAQERINHALSGEEPTTVPSDGSH